LRSKIISDDHALAQNVPAPPQKEEPNFLQKQDPDSDDMEAINVQEKTIFESF